MVIKHEIARFIKLTVDKHENVFLQTMIEDKIAEAKPFRNPILISF